jgi:hypothetical protein
MCYLLIQNSFITSNSIDSFVLQKAISSKIDFVDVSINDDDVDRISLPRSNMHGRKRPFTEKNGHIRRSYTVSVHGHRIRSETVRNGFRIRRSYKNTE